MYQVSNGDVYEWQAETGLFTLLGGLSRHLDVVIRV